MRQRCFACAAFAWIENSVRCPEINLAPMTVYGPRTYRRERLIAYVGDHEVMVCATRPAHLPQETQGDMVESVLYHNRIPRHGGHLVFYAQVDLHLDKV